MKGSIAFVSSQSFFLFLFMLDSRELGRKINDLLFNNSTFLEHVKVNMNAFVTVRFLHYRWISYL